MTSSDVGINSVHQTFTRYGDLVGKVAIVTGAAQGVGKSIATELGRQGVLVAGVDLVWPEGIPDGTGESMFFQADICDPESMSTTIDAVARAFKSINILVNNAKWDEVSPILEISDYGWRRTMEVSLSSHLIAARLVVPHIVRAGRGSVISLSTPHAVLATINSGAYGIFKAAADRLMKQLALEYASRNVRFNSVMPGSVATERKARLFAEDPSISKRLSSNHPAGRIVEMEEIAHLVNFLASDDSSMITGQVIAIDGGLTLQLPAR